jgi:hypothetical protein
MPYDDSGRDVMEPETAQRRAWPCLRQFCVFLENRVGRLNELMRNLESLDVRVLAISIVDSVDCANVRLIFNQTDRAREKLELANYLFSEADVVGVELDDSDKPLTAVCTALLKAELNIHHVAVLRYRRGDRSAVALYVDDVDLALSTLEDGGFRIVTESDLLDQDDYL